MRDVNIVIQKTMKQHNIAMHWSSVLQGISERQDMNCSEDVLTN